MIPLYFVKQLREADSYAIQKLGIPSLQLMENASASVYNILLNQFPGLNKTHTIGIVCGKGNNAGDGFALARHFILNGYKTSILYLNEPEEFTEDARANFNILNKLAENKFLFEIEKYKNPADIGVLSGTYLIVDAILGTGFKGELKQPLDEIIELLNKTSGYKASIDVPSGLDCDTGYAESAFRADVTISLAELKRGLFVSEAVRYAGKIIKGNIGIGEAYFGRLETTEFLTEITDAVSGLPLKEKNVNKYTAGKVYIVAGSDKLPGAAALAAKGAFFSGAGAVVIAVPPKIVQLLQNKLSEVIVESYCRNANDAFLCCENISELSYRTKWCDTFVIGPGLGRQEETVNAVRKMISSLAGKLCVLDADALYAISDREYRNYDIKNMILTPHLGEFAKMISTDVKEIKRDIVKFGSEFSKETGAYLVLKGAPTLVFTPTGIAYINSCGNPGMAKFGTGDALTGIIAGFISQVKENAGRNDIEKTLLSAVFFHSYSADLLCREISVYSVSAEKILDNLGPSIIEATAICGKDNLIV